MSGSSDSIRCIIRYSTSLDRVDKTRGKTWCIDANLVTVREFPVACTVTEPAGSEVVQVHVSRNPMLRILEMMVLTVRQRMAHVIFTRH